MFVLCATSQPKNKALLSKYVPVNKQMVSLLICWQMKIQRLQTSLDCTLMLSLHISNIASYITITDPFSSQHQILQLLTILVWSDQAQHSRWEGIDSNLLHSTSDGSDSQQEMPDLFSSTSLSYKPFNTSLTSGILTCNMTEHPYLGLCLLTCLLAFFPVCHSSTSEVLITTGEHIEVMLILFAKTSISFWFS